MSISLAYALALRDYLEAEYSGDPPAYGTLGIIKVGSYQDSPETAPAVLTIHSYNPYDESYSDRHWEAMTNQDSQGMGQDRGFQIFGGEREIGGGGLYTYWWWLKLDYFMTRTGATQEMAWAWNDSLVEWLTSKVAAAQPHVLLLESMDGAQLLATIVESVVTRERGGKPTSYIWTSLIKVRGSVHRDT